MNHPYERTWSEINHPADVALIASTTISMLVILFGAVYMLYQLFA